MSDIKFRIGSDNSDFKKGLKGAESEAKGFATAMGKVGKQINESFGAKRIFQGLLQGLGIGTTQQIVDLLVYPFKMAAEQAEKLAGLTDKTTAAVLRLMSLKRTDEQNLEVLKREEESLQRQLAAYQGRNLSGEELVKQEETKLALAEKSLAVFEAQTKLEEKARNDRLAAVRKERAEQDKLNQARSETQETIKKNQFDGLSDIDKMKSLESEVGKDEGEIKKLEDKVRRAPKDIKAKIERKKILDTLDNLRGKAIEIDRLPEYTADQQNQKRAARVSNNQTIKDFEQLAEETDPTEIAKADKLKIEQLKKEVIEKRVEIKNLAKGLAEKETDEQKKAAEDLTKELEKQGKAYEDFQKMVWDARKALIKVREEVAKTKVDLRNQRAEEFAFTLKDAAGGTRGGGAAKGKAKVIGQKERQMGNILDQGGYSVNFDDSGRPTLTHADKTKAGDAKQATARFSKLYSDRNALRGGIANLNASEKDPFASGIKDVEKATREAVKVLEEIKTAKFTNQ